MYRNRIKVYVISLGCPKNRVDTEKMLGIYEDSIEVVSSLKEAEIVLINTCAFIQPAVEESISTILEVAREIKSRSSFLVVTGCFLKRYGHEILKKELPEVDFWIPMEHQHNWLSTIGSSYNLGFKRDFKRYKRLLTTEPGYAYIKIAEGCNHRCSFCLIPYIRGKFSSREIDEVKKEVDFLVKKGVKEIIIVAQDVTFYGKDKGIKDGLKRLLSEIIKYDIKWLRLLYLNPSGITKDLLRFLKEISPPFVPYFDVPVQHSHPEILKRMGRNVKSPFKIQLIRDVFCEASIRTTVIVGFPGEREKHFDHLIDFIKKMRFNHLGVFRYYHEEGIRSYNFIDDVEDRVKEERRKIVLKFQREISREHLRNYKDKELEVIIDKPSFQWPTLFMGRAWFQAPEIDGITYVSCIQKNPVGKIVKVRIDETYDYDLSGLEMDSDNP